MSGTAIFRAQTAGANRVARDLSEAARDLRKIIIAEFRAAEEEIRAPFVEFAPEDTGALRAGLEVRIATAGRIQATVHSTVRDPESGFPYTDVTRFGHRGAIYPVHATRLRFYRYGRWNVRWSTAGFHPATDWAEEAQPYADAVAADVADRIGRVVYTRLL